MKFTNKEKVSAEMELRHLSEKAYKIYSETDPLDVYLKNKVFYLRGILNFDNLTFDEVENLFLETEF